MSAASRSSERRIGERRRGRRAPTADESWFGAFESAEDTQVSADTTTSGAEAPRTEIPLESDTAAGDSRQTGDSRFLSRQAERIVSSGQTAFDRIFRTFVGARAALGVALVVALAASGLFGNRPSLAAATSGRSGVLSVEVLTTRSSPGSEPSLCTILARMPLISGSTQATTKLPSGRAATLGRV